MSLENENIAMQQSTSTEPVISAPSAVNRFSIENLKKYVPIDIHLIILAIWPPLLLLIKGGWGFSSIGGIDAWLYLGYMLDLPKHEEVFRGAYYGTRLPFLLPGYGLYQLFSPIVANYILHLSIYYIGIFSLYLILKNIFNRRTALLSALLLGAYGWYLVSTGWDYIDGMGMAYMPLTILLLLLAAKNKRWLIAMFAAGAFSIAFFTTNLFLVSFAPFLAVFYLFANWKFRKNNLFISLVVYFLGCITALIVFGLAYSAMTGQFLYFMDSISTAKDLLSGPNPWILKTAWLSNATWLVFPVMTAVSAFLILMICKIRPGSNTNNNESSSTGFFQIWFVMLFLFFLGCQLSPFLPALQIFYYTSYLIPGTFLVIGAVAAAPLLALTNKQFLWVGCSSFLILSLSHVTFPASSTGDALATTFDQLLVQFVPRYSIEISVALIMAGFLFLGLKSKRPELMSLALLCFGLCNALVSLKSLKPHSSGDTASFLATVNSAQVVKAVTPEEDGYFWYAGQSTLGGVYRAVASTNLWGYRLINESFPSLVGEFDKNTVMFTIGQKVILLSTDNNALYQAKMALKTIGLTASFVTQKEILVDNIRFIMIFTIIAKGTNDPSTF